MIKNIDARFELFPGAIFPSGGDLINISEDIKFKVTELQGIRPESKSKEVINCHYFFKFMKINYFTRLAENDFGLNYYREKNTETTRLGLGFKEYSNVTKNEIQNTKEWLRCALQEQSFNDSILLVVVKEYIIDKKTRKVKSEKIIDEQTINLY